MDSFHFRLARVLEWYEKQLQLEENQLADCHLTLSKAQKALADVRAARAQMEQVLIHSSSMAAGDLRAMEQFRRKSLLDEKRINAECDTAQSKVQAQLEVVKLAQRKVRLLEKLRERRQAEHTYAANRELEELAADTYLAKFVRVR